MRLMLLSYQKVGGKKNLTLEDVIKKENFKIITNVKQRDFRGGKPALIINEEKYNIKLLCPNPITVPIGVEAVWALITPKINNGNSQIKNIALCAIYYRGPKSTKKNRAFFTKKYIFLKKHIFKKI